MVLMRAKKSESTPLIHSGLRIPKNFSQEIVRVNEGLSAIQRNSIKEAELTTAKGLLSSPSHIHISLIKEEEFKDNPSLKVARMTSFISRRQDLHHLHFGMIYYAAKAGSSTIRGWKIPQLNKIPAHLRKNFRKNTQAQFKNLLHRLTKVQDEDKEQATRAKELEERELALEREYSKRRNYRISNHLHT